MTDSSAPQKLYLFRLSTATVPTPGGPISMSSGCYLVVMGNGKHILIDSGLPADYHQPANVPSSENVKNVLEHLSELGVSPDAIDTVICTHFDVDHAGHHDSFKNAEFVVQRKHYELGRSGFARYAGARPYWDHPALRYRLVDGDVELLPGLTLLETSGHTLGHQSVLLHLPRTGAVLLAIDAVVMQRFFTPERRATPMDEDEEQLRASTRKLLEIVEREQIALTVFGHDGEQWQALKKSPEYYD